MFSDTLFITFFATLFAMMNPITNLPVFLALTKGGLEKHRIKIASTVALSLFILLTLVVFVGPAFLKALGVTVYAFEITGGFIGFMIALSMLNAKQSNIDHPNEEETKESLKKPNPAIVPLTMPLLGGPGAMTAIVIFTNKMNHNLTDYSTILAVVYSMIAIIWVVFCLGTPLLKLLGTTGMNVLSRFMAIILASIGVGMMINGFKVAFSIS